VVFWWIPLPKHTSIRTWWPRTNYVSLCCLKVRKTRVPRETTLLEAFTSLCALTRGSGSSGNMVMLRNTANQQTCKQICGQSQYTVPVTRRFPYIWKRRQQWATIVLRHFHFVGNFSISYTSKLHSLHKTSPCPQSMFLHLFHKRWTLQRYNIEKGKGGSKNFFNALEIVARKIDVPSAPFAKCLNYFCRSLKAAKNGEIVGTFYKCDYGENGESEASSAGKEVMSYCHYVFSFCCCRKLAWIYQKRKSLQKGILLILLGFGKSLNKRLDGQVSTV